MREPRDGFVMTQLSVRNARDRRYEKGEKLEEVGWKKTGKEKVRERTGCRKLEGRRSRPGLVLGLADSLALSRRNASNAGEPLLYLSFFNARSPSPVRLRPQASTFLLPAAILRGLHPPPPPPLSLFSLSLFHQPPFHSVHSLLRRSNDTRGCSLPRIPLILSFPSLSPFLSLLFQYFQRDFARSLERCVFFFLFFSFLFGLSWLM